MPGPGTSSALTGPMPVGPVRAGLLRRPPRMPIAASIPALALLPDITGERECRLEVVVGGRPGDDDLTVTPDGDTRGGRRRIGSETRRHLAPRAEARVQRAVGI